VLLLGETGTGKGVVARHIHALSPREGRPFVTVNCAVISPNLIENELFGHARGAFTGADSARIGHVEAAGNGTLFLDEVGDLPREAQGKLLRLLEEHEYVRVGDTEPRSGNARVIAATHCDLKAAVSAGTFREDLFYRLNVVTLRMPALRERREDIPALAEAMIADLSAQHRREPLRLDPAATAALEAYAWPGNLRELRHEMQRALVMAAGRGEILAEDLSPALRRAASVVNAASAAPEASTLEEKIEALERREIAVALEATSGNRSQAAARLGLSRQGLLNKMDRYGLK
jgi:DNA-binding NtrC family response regulator